MTHPLSALPMRMEVARQAVRNLPETQRLAIAREAILSINNADLAIAMTSISCEASDLAQTLALAAFDLENA